MKSCSMPQSVLRPQSLPSRERGLKSKGVLIFYPENRVAPFAGAWIEIILSRDLAGLSFVAPFAGAWIEMHNVGVHKYYK